MKTMITTACSCVKIGAATIQHHGLVLTSQKVKNVTGPKLAVDVMNAKTKKFHPMVIQSVSLGVTLILIHGLIKIKANLKNVHGH